DGALYVTGPTLAPYDSVYRIDADGVVTVINEEFGRPQGLAFDNAGSLHVVEALAGASGLYRLRLRNGGPSVRELAVAGADLVGVAFDRRQGFVVCSSDSAYKFVDKAF